MSKETSAETLRELDMSRRRTPTQAEEICCPIIELRQYIHHPDVRSCATVQQSKKRGKTLENDLSTSR